MVLYKIGKSFNIFEDESQAAWCHKMNLVQNNSSAKLFAEVLLDEIYGKMKIDVLNVIDTCTYLNYVIDGSSNISHKKIVNLFVYTQIGIFQIELEKIPVIKHSASKPVK